MKKQTRSEAREALFTQVFQLPGQRDSMDEARKYMLEAMPECEQNIGYIADATNGILTHESEIIKIISDNLKRGWSFDRLSKASKAILKIAVYEILYCDDVPAKVAVNEAVNLAKKYCDEREPRFINGVLAGVLRGLEL